MRHDITEPNCIIPLKWFTWGYELHESRWWFYWMVRMPGRSWERCWFDYDRDRRYRWCHMIVSYRKWGFEDDYVAGCGIVAGPRARRYDVAYWPIEHFE